MNSPMVYELHRPNQVDPAKTYPALFVMHGIGGNEQVMLSLVNGLEEQFYIFSIRGHLQQGSGFAYFTIEGIGKPNQEVFNQAAEKLTSLIDYATEHYPIDVNQIYLMGFSQGAIMSMTLGLKLGNRIKGIIALSGYIPGFVKEEYNVKPINHLAIFISHGEKDQVIPYEWGIANHEYFKQLGAKVTFKTYAEGHTVSIQNYRDFRNWLQKSLEN